MIFFYRISRQLPEKSDVCRSSINCTKSNFENCREFWNLWKLFNIIQYYSFVSLMETSALTAARRSLTCDQLACASRCENAFFAAIEKITSSSSKVVSCILLKFETYNIWNIAVSVSLSSKSGKFCTQLPLFVQLFYMWAPRDEKPPVGHFLTEVRENDVPSLACILS